MVLEFPSGIPPEKRQVIHWVADDLQLGSLTRGPKGAKKRVLVGHLCLAPEAFAKDFDKRQRNFDVQNSKMVNEGHSSAGE